MKYKDWCPSCTRKETWHCNECISPSYHWPGLWEERPTIFTTPEDENTIVPFLFGVVVVVCVLLSILIFK